MWLGLGWGIHVLGWTLVWTLEVLEGLSWDGRLWGEKWGGWWMAEQVRSKGVGWSAVVWIEVLVASSAFGLGAGSLVAVVSDVVLDVAMADWGALWSDLALVLT